MFNLRFVMISVVLCLWTTGCTNKIVKPADPAGPTISSGLLGHEQLKISYSIFPTRKEPDEIAKSLEESLSAQGITDFKRADSPEGDRTHLTVYVLDGRMSTLTRYTYLAVPFYQLATLISAPACGEMVYPVEIHVLPPPSNGVQSSIVKDEFIVRECEWVPAMFRFDREVKELKRTAMRSVFDQAVRGIIASRWERAYSDEVGRLIRRKSAGCSD